MMPFANFDRFVTGELLAPPWMSLPMLAVWLAAALGIGAFALRGRSFRSLWLEFVLGVAVMAWSAVFLSSFLLRLPAWLPPLLSAPAAGYGMLHLLRRVQAEKKKGDALPLLPFCAVVAAFALFTFASALFPPYGWDEQVYQTALLRRFLAEGSAAVRMDNPYSAYPSLPHFALMWAAAAGGVEFPRLATWALLVLLLAAFYRELRCRYAVLPAATATLAVALSPLVLAAGREFYTDLWSACFAFAGALVLLPREGEGTARRAEEVPELRMRLLTAGVFAASAVSVKLPGGGAALALAVLAFGAFLPGGVKHIGWFLLGGAAAALPFFLRVWLATGDPFYPWGSVLTGDAVAAQVAEFHRQLGRYRYGLEGVPGVALGWIFAAFDAKLYDGIAVGWQLPVLLLTSGTWMLRRRELSAPPFRTRSDFAAAAMLTLYLFWSLTSQQSRFLLPLLMAAAWGSAAVLARSGCRQRRILAGIVLISSLAGFSLPAAYHYVVAWRRCAAARREPAMHLAAAMRDPGYVAAMNELAKLPAGSRVLMLGERRTLYARPRCVPGDPLFQGERFTPPPGSAEEFAAGLAGFDYLYLGTSPVEIDRLEQYAQLRRNMEEFAVELLRRGELRMIFSSGGNHLLEVRTRFPQAQREGVRKRAR